MANARSSRLADRSLVLPSSLTVSIVTYRPDAALLERCLASSRSRSARRARSASLTQVAVALIDNSEDRDDRASDVHRRSARRASRDSGVQRRPTCTATRTSATAPRTTCAARHRRRLSAGAQSRRRARARRARQRDALARRASGRRRARAGRDAARRHARLPVQALSGGVRSLPARVRAARSCAALFRRRLERYEMRDVIDRRAAAPVRRHAGAVGRVHAGARARRSTAPAASIPKFFLYFEDFDWSVRLEQGRRKTAYLPSVRVVHHGGGAARKGWRHIGWFVRSGVPLLQQARLEVVLSRDARARPDRSSSPAPTASSAARCARISRATGRPVRARRARAATAATRRTADVMPRRRSRDGLRRRRSTRCVARRIGGRASRRRARTCMRETAADPARRYRAANVVATERLARAAVRAGVRASSSRARSR